jgi:hypothetical protein
MILEPASGLPAMVESFADLRGKLRFLLAMAIVGATPDRPTDLDRLFARLIAGRSSKARTRAERRVSEMMRLPVDARRKLFGRYGSLAPDRYRGADFAETWIGDDAQGHRQLPRAATPPELGSGVTPTASPTAPTSPRSRFGLYLNAVQRLDGAESPGCGAFTFVGSAIDTEGTARRIAQITIAENFEAGETRRFAGAGRLLHEWTPHDTAAQSNPCALMLCTVEEGDEGLVELLSALWRKIRDEVTCSATEGPPSADRQAISGSVAGWLMEDLIEWFGALLEDRSTTCATVLDDAWPANDAFSVIHGGRYRVWCSLRAGSEAPARLMEGAHA